MRQYRFLIILTAILASGAGAATVSSPANAVSTVLIAQAVEQRTTPAPVAKFDVVSIRVVNLEPGEIRLRRFDMPLLFPLKGSELIENAHVQDLLMDAFELRPDQIVNLPGWAASPWGTLYALKAKSENGRQTTASQLRQMLQAMLADRFQLSAHYETRPDVPVYALGVKTGGARFHAVTDSPAGAASDDRGWSTGTTIGGVAELMALVSDRPVVDHTGLPPGRYDFTLDQLTDESWGRPGGDRLAMRDGLFAAIRNQLGLTISAEKGPVDVLVIDHIEPPSRN